METTKVGMAAVAILLLVAGTGIGIAQAGGNHSERPVLSFDDMDTLERGSSPIHYTETRRC